MLSRAVFLDRDGVINRKREDYVKNINEFVMLKNVPQAIKLLNQNNFLVIIITNQSAINRGLLTHDDLTDIHDFMKKELKKHGAFIDAIYYCPHKPDENCKCRKPRTDLIEKAIEEHSISIDSSWFIGDSESDVLAAKTIGITSIRMTENGNLLEQVDKIFNR
jgi:histidinol-phosphate phosphatase family protein